MSGFGAYLKRIRESRGMTVNQLAMYSDISAATISRIETGKRGVPKPNTIKKLSAALKIPYGDMMREAGYMPTKGNEDLFNTDIDNFELTDEQIIEKYNLKVDGVPLTPEQIKLFINIIRAGRMN